MRTIKLGILGLGSETTAFYIRRLNEGYNTQKGGYSTCPFLLLNADFDEINSLLPTTSTALDSIMQKYLSEMEKLPITQILIPNITLHKTIDRLPTSKKIIHPLHLTATKIKENNYPKVVLFGSMYTMESDYISSYFETQNIAVVLPKVADRLLIDEVRKQIYAKTATSALIAEYHSLLEKYSKKYPVILACTELSIFNPRKEELPILDMVEIQVETAIQQVLNKK